MPLRRRLALTVALVAAAVVLFGGAAAWLTTRSVLLGNIDDSLRAQVQAVRNDPRRGPDRRLSRPPGDTGALQSLPSPPPRLGGPAEYSQLLTSAGAVVTRGDVELPVTDADRRAVREAKVLGPRDVQVGDTHLRMITVPLSEAARRRLAFVDVGGTSGSAGVVVSAFQFARPLNGVDSALRTLALALLAVGIVIVGIAAALGRTAARRILRPVADLADAAAHVEATADLDRRLPVRSGDEVGELTRRFNGMLARLQGSRTELDRSMAEQRNLVADASHELRTPVTSLRTNAEVLLEDDDTIDAAERKSILADVRDQAEDLGLLVSDLIELARGDVPDHDADEPVALDALVEECVTRARRDHRGVTFTTALEPLVVEGRPDRLARAVSNLLNNAALHGAGGSGTVEVRVDATEAAAPLPVAPGEACPGPVRPGDAAPVPVRPGHAAPRPVGPGDALPRPVRPGDARSRPAGPGDALSRPARPREAARSADRRGADGPVGEAGVESPAGRLGTDATLARQATVAVIDHGPGVPEADRARVFDRFRRGDSSRAQHGSGLGLAIVRQVAIVHGGEVRVVETAGGGATFLLTLPLAAD